MSNEEIEKNIREYITKTPHMSLATARDNKPWVCEVHFASDRELNLYSVSRLSTRHCQEIALNPHVAGNIVKQHGLEESPHGIYFEGNAEVMENPPAEAIDGYCRALGRDPEELESRLTEPGGHRLYKIAVNAWSIFGKFGHDANAKHTLSWNGGEK